MSSKLHKLFGANNFYLSQKAETSYAVKGFPGLTLQDSIKSRCRNEMASP